MLNNNILNQDFFIETIYQLSLEQLSFQQLYSNLFKDIYHYLSFNKNELKFFRKKLINKCKQNLTNKKICLSNQKIINNNIALIGELINAKIFPKKMGLKCFHFLFNKFNKYSDKNNAEVKYIYLECIIILLNLICSYMYNFQKERIHPEFNEEITNIINKLKEINNDEKNNDMPKYTKHLLMNIIDKSNNKWELLSYEQKNYSSHFEILNKETETIPEENNNKSFNDSSFIKEDEYDKSFNEEDNKEEINEKEKNIIKNDDIELEEDKKGYKYSRYNTNSNYKKNRYNNDFDYSKSSSTLSFNKKKTDFYSNSNNYYKYNSNSNNNLYNPKYSKDSFSGSNNGSFYNNNNTTSNNNQKIILNNLKLFRRHIDNNLYIDNFKWDDIHNLIVYEKVGMNDFIEILIEACLSFSINRQSSYYIDLYIKAIFDYYKNYLEKNDFNDIRDAVINKLESLYNNKNNEYYYLENILIILIYYLMDNQILTMHDFNMFNKDSLSIKKNIAKIINKIIEYKRDTEKILFNKLKATKFYNENINLFDRYY